MASQTIFAAGDHVMVFVRRLLGKAASSSDAWLDSNDMLGSGSDPNLPRTCSQITVGKSYVHIYSPGSSFEKSNCSGCGAWASMMSKEGCKGPGILEHAMNNHSPLARNQEKHSRGSRHWQGLPDLKCFQDKGHNPEPWRSLALIGKVSRHSSYPFQLKVS